MGITWPLAHWGIPRTGTPGKWAYQSLDLLRSVDAAEMWVVADFDFGDESWKKPKTCWNVCSAYFFKWLHHSPDFRWVMHWSRHQVSWPQVGLGCPSWPCVASPFCCCFLVLCFLVGSGSSLMEHTFVWTLPPPLSLGIKVHGGGWSQGSSETRGVIHGEVHSRSDSETSSLNCYHVYFGAGLLRGHPAHHHPT